MPTAFGVAFAWPATLRRTFATIISRLPLDRRRHRVVVQRQQLVRLVGAATTGAEVAPQHVVGDAGDRERRHRGAQAPVGVAVLEAARQRRLAADARDDAEVTAPRDRARELPARDADAHAALDDHRPRGRRIDVLLHGPHRTHGAVERRSALRHVLARPRPRPGHDAPKRPST
jgi:hypothetical protein